MSERFPVSTQQQHPVSIQLARGQDVFESMFAVTRTALRGAPVESQRLPLQEPFEYEGAECSFASFETELDIRDHTTNPHYSKIPENGYIVFPKARVSLWPSDDLEEFEKGVGAVFDYEPINTVPAYASLNIKRFATCDTYPNGRVIHVAEGLPDNRNRLWTPAENSKWGWLAAKILEKGLDAIDDSTANQHAVGMSSATVRTIIL